MANILLGGGITDMRGSIGGTTFSRSAAGNYARARMKPVNPRSALQNLRRANLAHLANHWSQHLTPEERADWRAYAEGTTWSNRLGQSIDISGLAAFVRLNTLLLIGGEGLRTAAPLAMGHAGGVPFTFAAESPTGPIKVNCPGGSFDKDTLSQVVLFFQGLPSEAGRLAIPKGFRYIGRVYGHDTTPLEYPFPLDSAYSMVDDQLVTVRAMFHDENYRVSGPFWATDTAGPPT